jgi:DNA repair protein RadD
LKQYVPYVFQSGAIKAGLEYFSHKKDYNGLLIAPTGSGKSVIIANIAKELREPTLIFQPSIEILKQNFAKFISYGFRASVFSASARQKIISNVTFSTIGSAVKKKHLFRDFKHIIVDECHLVNPMQGMYQEFINSFDKVRVLGLTATPYRLTSGMDGSMLKFITRTNPRIFNRVNYFIQNDVLFDNGTLSKLEYYPIRIVDRSRFETNKTGSDFTDQSIRNYYRQINMPKITAEYANRLLQKRKNLLVFCSLVSEAKEVQKSVPGSVVISDETSPSQRELILKYFTTGRIKCVINVGVLTTGFDYPELECVLIARSTMSLAIYYQIIGRVMRAHPNKRSGWVVDLGGNYDIFGKIETMKIQLDGTNKWAIYNNGQQLTNVLFRS